MRISSDTRGSKVGPLLLAVLAVAASGCGRNRYVTVEGEYYRHVELAPGTTLPMTVSKFTPAGTSEDWRIEPNEDFNKRYADLAADPLQDPIVLVRLSGWRSRPDDNAAVKYVVKVDRVHMMKTVGHVPAFQGWLPR